MKKIFVLTLIALFACPLMVQARTVYDSTGRHIVHDGTLRGQQRAAKQRTQNRNMQPASAAAIDYNQDYFNNTGYVKTGRVPTITTTVQDRRGR